MSNIRQYLPLISKPNESQAPNLNALLDGADEIIAHLEAYTEHAQNQFFFTTADAEYIFKLAARNGFYLPRDSNLNIEGLQPLAPLLINHPKTVLSLLLQIIEIYFSQSLSRPIVVCAQPEPYRLRESDDLIVKTREAEHRLTIDPNAFFNIKNVSASELSTYINSVQDHFIASVFYDRATGKNRIQLTAGGTGPNEIIQVSGGTLQNILLFPNVVPTTNTVQTRWAISKIADYSDIVTFTYLDGEIPSVHLTKVGDIVTIRNQFDVDVSGLVTIPVKDIFGDDVIDNQGNLVVIAVDLIEGNYSVLNGTHEIIEMGYNYFKIRNKYLKLPISNYGEMIQLSSRDMIFTENIPHRVYEQPAFTYMSEMTDDELAFTVPPVPPIVKRFLQGAWHFCGFKHSIVDFSRDSLEIDTNTSIKFPISGNQFTIQSPMLTANFFEKKFKVAEINNTSGFISLDTSDEYAIFPYTSPTLVEKNNPFFCDFESNEIEMSFNYRHGLVLGSQIVITSAVTNPANSININGSWIVDKIISPTKISFKINQKNIAPPSSSTAILFSLGNQRYRLQYPSSATFNLSNLGAVGKKFRLFEDGTANVFNSYMWQKLKSKMHKVLSIGVNSIEFEALDNWSVLPNQIIASNVKIQTTETTWGGSLARCHFDKSSESNINLLVNGLEMVSADYAKPDSPLLLGSYLFDPDGVVYKFLPSSVGAYTKVQVLKGESGVIVDVDSAIDFDNKGGYVVFNYGTDTEEGPIPYFGITNTQILIDPSYAFKFSHIPNSSIRQVKQLNPFNPTPNGLMFQPFVTGTSKARNSFFQLVKTIISAGVFVTEDVLYPELRFVDESIKPYE